MVNAVARDVPDKAVAFRRLIGRSGAASVLFPGDGVNGEPVLDDAQADRLRFESDEKRLR